MINSIIKILIKLYQQFKKKLIPIIIKKELNEKFNKINRCTIYNIWYIWY